METAPFINPQENPPPKDGTLLILLVRVIDRDNWYPTEDSEIFRTIGSNDADMNGDNTWRCVGWNWCADEFVETTGDILGWLPMPNVPDAFIENSSSEEADSLSLNC